jgi:hypothetical protein
MAFKRWADSCDPRFHLEGFDGALVCGKSGKVTLVAADVENTLAGKVLW